jgi:opacity protein-like surface antigen
MVTLHVAGCAVPGARAAGPEDPLEVGGVVGYTRGDTLAEFDDATSPQLDDAFTLGAYFVRHLNESWGLMTRVTVFESEVTELLDDARVDASFVFLDVSATYQWNWDDFSIYAPFGVGWTFANIDRPLIAPDEGASPVDADDEASLHFGAGIIWPLRDRVNLRFEGRYRIAGDVLTKYSDTADFFEWTIGAGWTF